MALDWYERAPDCPRFPAAQGVKRLKGRWKTPILSILARGPARFAALRAALGEVSDKMLAQQLQALEADGLVARTEVVSAPPKVVEYRLTPLGEAARPVLAALSDFAAALRAASRAA